jgi:serine/threonine-protein phosphatase 2A regulatory subunit B''
VDEFFRRWVGSGAGSSALQEAVREAALEAVSSSALPLTSPLRSPGRALLLSPGGPRSPGSGALGATPPLAPALARGAGFSPTAAPVSPSTRSPLFAPAIGPGVGLPVTSPRAGGGGGGGGGASLSPSPGAGTKEDDAFPSSAVLAQSELSATVAAAAAAAAAVATSPESRGAGAVGGGGGGGAPLSPSAGERQGGASPGRGSGGGVVGSPTTSPLNGSAGIRLPSLAAGAAGGASGSSDSGSALTPVTPVGFEPLGALAVAAGAKGGAPEEQPPALSVGGGGGRLSAAAVAEKCGPLYPPAPAPAFAHAHHHHSSGNASAVSSPGASPTLSAASSPATSPPGTPPILSAALRGEGGAPALAHAPPPLALDALVGVSAHGGVAPGSPPGALSFVAAKAVAVTESVACGLNKVPSPLLQRASAASAAAAASASASAAAAASASAAEAKEGKEDEGLTVGAAASVPAASAAAAPKPAPAAAPPAAGAAAKPVPAAPAAPRGAALLPPFFNRAQRAPLPFSVALKGNGAGGGAGASGATFTSTGAHRGPPSDATEKQLSAIVELFRRHNVAPAPAPHSFSRSNAAAAGAARAAAVAAASSGSGGAGGARPRSGSVGRGGKGGVAVGGKASGGGAAGKAGGAPASATSSRSASPAPLAVGGARARASTEEEEGDEGPPPGTVAVAVELGGGGARARSAPLSLTWEDAQLAISHEHFASVAKPLAGFPSFFAAPLFRRIRALYGGASPDEWRAALCAALPAGWAAEAAVVEERALATAAYHSAAAAAAGAPAAAAAAPQKPGARTPSPSAGGPVTLALLGTSVKAGVGAAGAAAAAAAAARAAAGPPPPPLPPPALRAVRLPLPSLSLNSACAAAAAAGERDTTGVISLPQFLAWWEAEVAPYDRAARFFRLLAAPGSPGIAPGDFSPFLDELLSFHPGLQFLNAEGYRDFQEKYKRTVVARIFFEWDPDALERLSLRTLRASNLVEAFLTVDVETDINQVNDYFSYEHFYVLYCKFWELDKDRDFFLSRADLGALANITAPVLDRVYAQAGKRFVTTTLRSPAIPATSAMGYEDFIFFFLASEDKTVPAALRYWFNVCDLDGDGALTSADLRPFFAAQAEQLATRSPEVVKPEDVLCQFADLLHPSRPGRIVLGDFLNPERVKLTGVFFNALFDVEKFIRFESRVPIYVKQGENYEANHVQWSACAPPRRALTVADPSHAASPPTQPRRPIRGHGVQGARAG